MRIYSTWNYFQFELPVYFPRSYNLKFNPALWQIVLEHEVPGILCNLKRMKYAAI